MGEFSNGPPGMYAENRHICKWPQKVVPLRRDNLVLMFQQWPMLAKAQREFLCGRQHWCNRVADLSCSVYLPAEILTSNAYAEKAVVLMRSVVVHGYGHVVLM